MRRHRPDTIGVIRLISTSRSLGYARVRVEVARQLEAEYLRSSRHGRRGFLHAPRGTKHVVAGGIYGGMSCIVRCITLFKTGT